MLEDLLGMSLDGMRNTNRLKKVDAVSFDSPLQMTACITADLTADPTLPLLAPGSDPTMLEDLLDFPLDGTGVPRS